MQGSVQNQTQGQDQPQVHGGGYQLGKKSGMSGGQSLGRGGGRGPGQYGAIASTPRGHEGASTLGLLGSGSIPLPPSRAYQRSLDEGCVAQDTP